ncbi:MAG: amidohydrolase [Planctomycetaceae bacterium]|nr:MAG: amidohydrolase [Planctomycetaceae bacterium]
MIRCQRRVWLKRCAMAWIAACASPQTMTPQSPRSLFAASGMGRRLKFVSQLSCQHPFQTIPTWIDAHCHIWAPPSEEFPLAEGITEQQLQPRSFNPQELLTTVRPHGVGRVVLIQHSIFHRFDNRYIIDAVRRNPQTFRAVGMLDDHQPRVAEQMPDLLGQGMTGFRITPLIREGAAAHDWLQTSGMQEMWRMAARTRQAMCCLINPSDLSAVDAMCAQHPETPVVIDHFARIGMDGSIREEQLAALCRLARHPFVYVKLSAYYALGHKRPPHTELLPMIHRLLETFSPRRLMWASDSPYQLQNGNTYASSLGLIRDGIPELSATDRQQLLRGTAEAVYWFR